MTPYTSHLPQSAAFCHILSLLQDYPVFAISAVSAEFCRILPSSAKFCQNRHLSPALPVHSIVPINLVTKRTLYTLFLLFFTFFPYVMSWLHHTVYVCSLIISTSLYIIIAYTHSVTIVKVPVLDYIALLGAYRPI